jgi:HAE1 family hydrophobic/amphiphilic exporter-1
MQWLAALCVRRPIFASVLILVLCVIGIAGYMQLGVDRFPNVDFPSSSSSRPAGRRAPEDIETEITDKVEEAVNTISGIDELRSRHDRGRLPGHHQRSSSRRTWTSPRRRCATSLNTVLKDLPKDIDQPVVQKLDPDAAPILFFALKAQGHTLRETTELADKRLRRSLESIDGVGQVQLVGGRKRQINVVLDPIRLRGAQVTSHRRRSAPSGCRT